MTSPDTNLPNLAQPLPSAGEPPGQVPSAAAAPPTPESGMWSSLIQALNHLPAEPQITLTATGPAMKVDIDTVNQVIAGWNEVLNKVQAASDLGEPLTRIKNPGNDSGSHDFANRANPVGNSHWQANLAIQRAVQAHIGKLTAAVRQYQATEQGNTGNLNRQDK